MFTCPVSARVGRTRQPQPAGRSYHPRELAACAPGLAALVQVFSHPPALLAEQAGEVSPDGMQRLLRRADWDVDGSATTSVTM